MVVHTLSGHVQVTLRKPHSRPSLHHHFPASPGFCPFHIPPCGLWRRMPDGSVFYGNKSNPRPDGRRHRKEKVVQCLFQRSSRKTDITGPAGLPAIPKSTRQNLPLHREKNGNPACIKRSQVTFRVKTFMDCACWMSGQVPDSLLSSCVKWGLVSRPSI